MKKFPILAAVLVSAVSLSVSAQEYGPLTLRYDSPADMFERALVIGNGTFGGAVYGGPQEDIISLNDITLWTGEPETYEFGDRSEALAEVREALFREDYHAAWDLSHKLQGHFSQNYQPLGTLKIKYPGHKNISNYSRLLDISSAFARTKYLADGRWFECGYFASAPDSAIVIRLRDLSNSAEGISAEVSLDSQLPHECSSVEGCAVSDGYAAYYSKPGGHGDEHRYDPDRGIHFRTMMKAVPTGGSATVREDGTIIIEGCKEVLLIVVNATSFNGFDKDPVKEGRDYKALAASRIASASAKGYGELLSAHTADYKSYFDRVKLYLGRTPESRFTMDTEKRLIDYLDRDAFDPALEVLYYQFARYLLISSSRTPGIPPNLQGLWNEYLLPPWSSNYTININLEENFWGAKNGNLLEMEQSLLSFVKNLSVAGKHVAKDFYSVDEGWCSGHNSDVWAMANPVGEGTGMPLWANWTMGGAWLATDIWENYAYSKDKKELEKYYPTLKGAAEFCLNWLIEKDGELLTAPSTSPENNFFYEEGKIGEVCYGGTADLAIIRECLMDASDAAKALHKDRKFRRRISKTLARLHPYTIGADGNLQEWFHDWKDPEPTHRHHSHMIGLYPGHSIDPLKDTVLAKACIRTLDIKGDQSTGWSTGWKINLLARLRLGERAYSVYRNLLAYKEPTKGYSGPGGTFPNFLDAHPPFQIDGNFGGNAGVTEMLMQSTMTDITLLPALPSRWAATGSVSGLLARGGFEIGFSWTDGKVTQVEIASAKGGKTTLHYNGQTRKIRLKTGQKLVL